MKNGQKLYIYDGGVEVWTYYYGYDGQHIISDGGERVDHITDKELRKFSTTEDECVMQICKKYFNIQNQCKEKMNFLNKEIETLTNVVKDTQDNIQNHIKNKIKLENAMEGLNEDFRPLIEQYPELFI